MKFFVLTLFPDLVQAYFDHGLMGRAIRNRILTARCIPVREFAQDTHHTVDDRPYGGGCGMVMKPDPLAEAIESARNAAPEARVVFMTPQGIPFCQEAAGSLARAGQDLIFVCGRYEGIDERIIARYADLAFSIGDYVLSGGELASMVIMDAVSRLIPGVLGNRESSRSDTFMDDRLEYAQYTRPESFCGDAVPDVLLSGDHGRIHQWRTRSSLARTLMNRPDLLRKKPVSPEEKAILQQWRQDIQELLHG